MFTVLEMAKFYKHILFITILLFSMVCICHSCKKAKIITNKTFTIKGSVIESDTNKPIPKVNILVNGGAYTTTNLQGEFKN